ncbi:MAG TPA: hypothetical protein VIF15_04525 [Polyangiaceae bacterium]|jgi:hypothetical protein
MPERREPSHPPSEPHPALSGAGAGGGGVLSADDRPVRVQLAAALLLGLVLVASGLYLWRRPHVSPDAQSSEVTPAAPSASGMTATGGIGGATIGSADGGSSSPVALSDPRVLACQDRGSKRTPPDQCDHLASVEQALASAIAQSAACVPAAAGGGTIEYVADVSFSRHKVNVSLPRAGRSVHDRKVLRACSTAVRGAIQGVGLDSVDHQHARYKIAVTATYRSSASGG